MTTSDHRKVLKQLKAKPAKLEKYKKNNIPKQRSCGKALRKCKRCGSTHAHSKKYGLNLCRQCFREIATSIGFKKYR
ncbi:MAG: 30S ribosomal protein S14 [Nanoarchaeota archaeon]|nr:30S ribosomal protein S14 [Nanoarchaeota archaeon]